MNHKSQSKLFMKWCVQKDIDDGKEDIEEMKSEDLSELRSMILFNSSQKEYHCRLKNLDKYTKYFCKLLFYEERDGKLQIMKSSKQIVTTFITKDGLDFQNKFFKYVHDYDENGICYWLGTDYGRNNEWKNPAKLNRIKLESSERYGSIYDMIDRSIKKGYNPWEQTGGCSFSEKGWIVFNFGPIRIKPTYYTLRHRNSDNCYMKSWNLLGSLDGIKYEILDKHWHWISPFGGPGQSRTFKIDGNSNKYYRYFKIQITGKNSGFQHVKPALALMGGITIVTIGHWAITFYGLELYGYVCGDKL